MEYFFSLLIVVITGFLLGSVSFGLLIAKVFCGIDPRLSGSCNVGATNVARLCGFHWGVLTLLCDLCKGFVPVVLLTTSGSNLSDLAYPMGLAIICGHMFSMFLGFKGGKGVATTVGVFLAFTPWQLIISGIVCIIVIWRNGFVSAGSLVLVILLPVLLLLSGRWGDVLFALVVTALVIFAHRENIQRLLRGEEKPWITRHSDYV